MSNMSYCRFENTVIDVRDCLDALQDEDEMEELSEREKGSKKDLIELCKEIAEGNFGEDEDEDEG